jgi:acetyl esterase/lipase
LSHGFGKSSAVGVDARLEIYPHMWHVWQLFLKLPQAVQSLDDIAQFLGLHLGLCGKTCQTL